LDANEFWQLVDRAHKLGKNDFDARVDALREQLEKHSTDQLQSFQRHYDNSINAAYRWDLWGAAYIMNGGASDDGFRYFLDWLISEGSQTYSAALKSPESLALLPRVDYAENEAFGYVAFEVFDEKGAGALERGVAETPTPAGDEWAEDDLPALFPKLAKRYEFEA
jgi:Protein of unknown function (DUF4240)